MKIGEQWAYREKSSTTRSPVNRVEVLQLGPKGSGKVRIRFLDGESTGLDLWVPKRRLKVPWDEAEAWLRDERLLVQAQDASEGPRDQLEEDAVALAVSIYPRPNGILDRWPSGRVVTVANLDVTAGDLDLNPDDLLAVPDSFINRDGEYIAPWSVTVLLAHRVTERFPDLVLTEVGKLERDLRQRAAVGNATGNRWVDEHDAAEYAEELRSQEPIYRVVRDWCGQPAVDRYKEVETLRDEVRRLRELVLCGKPARWPW